MNRRIGLQAFLFLFVAALPAAAGEWDLSFNGSLGQRTDDFRWNIAGNTLGQSPNILSELTWSDLKIQELRLGAELRKPGMISLDAVWAAGRIVDGRNQDSDYLGNNRTQEFSRSNNTSDFGQTRDIRLAVGLPLGNPADMEVTPSIGWTHASQRLSITELVQTIPALGPFGGANIRYEHMWRGFFLGLETRTHITPRFRVAGALRYHRDLSYEAEADWNLRPEFHHPTSFHHMADGKGVDVEISVSQDFTPAFTGGLGFCWRRWDAGPGRDRIYFNDLRFSGGTTIDTRLNEVIWKSFSFRLFAAFGPGSGDDEGAGEEDAGLR